MSSEIYIRRSERDPAIERKPWDQSTGITKIAWEQESRIIKKTEKLHFDNDTEEDVTELHDYIYGNLHYSIDFLYVCSEEYRLLIKEFKTPIGAELASLYFAIYRSLSDSYYNDDTEELITRNFDIGIRRTPQNLRKLKTNDTITRNEQEENYLLSFDSDDLYRVLARLPLSNELRLKVYSQFKLLLETYAYDSLTPESGVKFETKAKAKWIKKIDRLIDIHSELVQKKRLFENVEVLGEIKKPISISNAQTLNVNDARHRMAQASLIHCLHQTQSWKDRHSEKKFKSKLAKVLTQNFLDEQGNRFPKLLQSLSKATSRHPDKLPPNIEEITIKIEFLISNIK